MLCKLCQKENNDNTSGLCWECSVKINFASIDEFNHTWFLFEKDNELENWRMPKCPIIKQYGLNYLKTERHEWLCIKIKRWLEYRENYLLDKLKKS